MRNVSLGQFQLFFGGRRAPKSPKSEFSAQFLAVSLYQFSPTPPPYETRGRLYLQKWMGWVEMSSCVNPSVPSNEKKETWDWIWLKQLGGSWMIMIHSISWRTKSWTFEAFQNRDLTSSICVYNQSINLRMFNYVSNPQPSSESPLFQQTK